MVDHCPGVSFGLAGNPSSGDPVEVKFHMRSLAKILNSPTTKNKTAKKVSIRVIPRIQDG